MPAETDDLPLAAEFPAATREAWLKLVDGVLKGAPRERLASKTADGLTIEPLYARAGDAKPVAGRAAATPWQIMQRADHPDAADGQQAGADRSGERRHRPHPRVRRRKRRGRLWT